MTEIQRGDVGEWMIACNIRGVWPPSCEVFGEQAQRVLLPCCCLNAGSVFFPTMYGGSGREFKVE